MQRWRQGRNAGGGTKTVRVPTASEARKFFTDHTFGDYLVDENQLLIIRQNYLQFKHLHPCLIVCLIVCLFVFNLF